MSLHEPSRDSAPLSAPGSKQLRGFTAPVAALRWSRVVRSDRFSSGAVVSVCRSRAKRRLRLPRPRRASGLTGTVACHPTRLADLASVEISVRTVVAGEPLPWCRRLNWLSHVYPGPLQVATPMPARVSRSRVPTASIPDLIAWTFPMHRSLAPGVHRAGLASGKRGSRVQLGRASSHRRGRFGERPRGRGLGV